MTGPTSNIKIIDNFLSEEYFLPLKTTITCDSFPWYYQNCVVTMSEDEILDLDSYQFFHIFYNSSNGNYSSYFKILNPILDELNAKDIIRIKTNLNTRKENILVRKLHVDVDLEAYPTAKTAIYYINTNNGYTLFEDGTKIKSIKNRMLIFNSNMLHTGATCTDKSNRIVINFNYLEHN